MTSFVTLLMYNSPMAFKNNQHGFTLVELMVTVAIVGLISSVAIPNFKKYQAKSKTVEAKLQLSAAYVSMQSFYSEYNTYQVCLKYMGYDPSEMVNSRLYAVGFGSDLSTGNCPLCSAAAIASGARIGPSGCYAAVNHSIFPAGKMIGTSVISTFTAVNVGNAAIAQETFIFGAVGVIDAKKNTASTASAYNINQDKVIKEVRTGY